MKISKMIGAVAALGLVWALGCGENKPAGPTTAEFNQRRKELASELKDRDGAKVRKPAGKANGGAAEDGFAAVGRDFSYDPTGRRDPFRSFLWEQIRQDMFDAQNAGPLEQFDLGQLALVGVIWDVNNPRALLEDPSGMSYVVGKGTRVGKSEGRITRIGDNLLVVREKYVDSHGNQSTQDVEMRIRASDGG